MLKRLGFTYKKNRLVPSKADPELQRLFVRWFQGLCARLKPDDRIYFGDAVHFKHNAEAGYAWSLCGEPHLIRVQSSLSPPKLLHLFGDDVTGLRAGTLISQRQFRQDFHGSYSAYPDRIGESHKKSLVCQGDMGDGTISPDVLTVLVVLMPTKPENRI